MRGWLDGLFVGWLVGWMDRWMDGWMDGCMDGCLIAWLVAACWVGTDRPTLAERRRRPGSMLTKWTSCTATPRALAEDTQINKQKNK